MGFSNFVERTTHSDASSFDIIGIDTSSNLGPDVVVPINIVVHTIVVVQTVLNLQFDA